MEGVQWGGRKRAKAGTPTCTVQMWDAALSRRMCCSRVCVAMPRRARLPCASTASATPMTGRLEERDEMRGGEERWRGEEVRRGAGRCSR